MQDILHHPLCRDAIATLIACRDAAEAKALKQDRRLVEERDDLPRGPLPVMTHAAELRATALHFDIALAALGYDHRAHGEQAPDFPDSARRPVIDLAEFAGRHPPLDRQPGRMAG